MLGKPEHGWALFQLGGEETAYDLSYLTDVPMQWLAQAIHGLRTMDVFSVHGYCEPGRVVCTVSFWCCYVIFEEDGRGPACRDVHQIPVNMLDFCRMLYRDLSEQLDAGRAGRRAPKGGTPRFGSGKHRCGKSSAN